MRFLRHSAFLFNGLLPLACFTQGTPGDGGGGGTPPVQPPANPAGTPPAVNPPQPRNEGGQFDTDPTWLPGRIKQAKENAEKEVLASLGVKDVEAAKKLLDEGKKAADAQKTELQRKDDEITSLKPAVAERDQYRDALTTRANAELATLPEAAQASIKLMLGDKPDPIKVLNAVDMARAMVPASAPPAGQQGQGQPGAAPSAPLQGQAKPPVPPAANTSGAQGGPPSADGSPPDHHAAWQAMQAKNPMAAAHYFLAHEAEIVAAQQAKTK